MTPLDKALAFFDKASGKLGVLSADVVPEGFFTAKVFAQAKRVTYRGMKIRLDAMVAAKLAEMREFRLANGRTASHYRMLEK